MYSMYSTLSILYIVLLIFVHSTKMMKMLSTSIIALALLCIQCAQSFTTPLQSPLTFTGSRSTIAFSPIVKNEASLKMSSDEGEAPRRRRTRKDGKNTQSVEAKEPVKEDKVEQPAVTIPKVDPVQMQVADIRDVVAGKVPAPLKVAPVVEEEEEDDLEDDEEYEYYYEDENNNEVIVGTSTSNDNSLDALLADARKLREGEEPEVEDTSMKKQIKSVLSTIVTADFFVILALGLVFGGDFLFLYYQGRHCANCIQWYLPTSCSACTWYTYDWFSCRCCI